MSTAPELPSWSYPPLLVTVLCLFEYVLWAARVGHARGKYNIEAPATTGHPDFERKFRVQMNHLEHMVVFIPALWIFSLVVSPVYAAYIGVVWLVCRFGYGFAYVSSPQSRVGFLVPAFLCQMIMLVSSTGLLVKRCLL